MNKIALIFGISTALFISACGGGGGSSGNTTERYSITLRAEKTNLPINIQPGGEAVSGPNAGAYAPYTTTLYVNAKEGVDPIPGGEDIFACNLAGGLDTGALYYLDGDDEHEDDDGNPLAYRNITLGANTGGNSFHFHAGTQAGTATITCSVTDPRDSRVYSASVNITVGAATGKPASVRAVAQAPGYLGSQTNQSNIRNNVAIQAFVMDDANQPVPNPSAPNLQVSMFATGASAGARLISGSTSGTSLQIRTTGGIGLISLSSGPNKGEILLEFTTDRYDNDVSNGIQDPVAQLAVVNVVDAVATTPLSVASSNITAPNGTLVGQALSATGGAPTYAWSALDPLPAGLLLSASGVISGTPAAAPGTYVVRVQATDQTGAVASGSITINVTGQVMVFTAPTLTTTVGLPFSYVLSASGGAKPYKWEALGTLPAGLTLDADTGVIRGTPTAAGAYSVAIRVADNGSNSVTANMTITVADPAAATP